MYIYIHLYVCIDIDIDIDIYIDIYIYRYIHIYKRVNIYTYQMFERCMQVLVPYTKWLERRRAVVEMVNPPRTTIGP